MLLAACGDTGTGINREFATLAAHVPARDRD